jgi:hypothetical protein
MRSAIILLGALLCPALAHAQTLAPACAGAGSGTACVFSNARDFHGQPFERVSFEPADERTPAAIANKYANISSFTISGGQGGIRHTSQHYEAFAGAGTSGGAVSGSYRIDWGYYGATTVTVVFVTPVDATGAYFGGATTDPEVIVTLENGQQRRATRTSAGLLHVSNGMSACDAINGLIAIDANGGSRITRVVYRLGPDAASLDDIYFGRASGGFNGAGPTRFAEAGATGCANPIPAWPVAGLGTDTDGDGIIDEDDNCANLANPLQHDTDHDDAGDVCDNDCPNTAIGNRSTWTSRESSHWLKPWGNACDGTAQNALDGTAAFSSNNWQSCNGRSSPRSFFAPAYTKRDAGEWMEINFPSSQTITGVALTQLTAGRYVSGLVSPHKYTAHVRDATLVFSDGSSLQVTFPDAVRAAVSFPQVITTSVRVIAQTFYNTTTNNPAWFVDEIDFTGISSAVASIPACEDNNPPGPPDSDGDGVPDSNDRFPNNGGEQSDTDGDGTGDNADSDDDNDGITDTNDPDPNTNDSTIDTDGDGVPNNHDADDDNDGANDDHDWFPLDDDESGDADGDFIGDNDDPCPNDAVGDSDGDGVCDSSDGCPANAAKTAAGQCGCSAAELDSDGDGAADCVDLCVNDAGKVTGGICGCGFSDMDSDGDGLVDCQDGCANDPLKTSAGICGCGTADTDNDADFTPNCLDACPDDQANDADQDGFCGDRDNCALVTNASQADLDRDLIGDACDDDVDGDFVPNMGDNCSLVPNIEQEDLDGDGTGDECDADIDADGVDNLIDNCPEIANVDQSDVDLDVIGDACDWDDDSDGVRDGEDNCALIANSGQANLDGDLLGDVCDSDDDDDGVPDDFDNCVRNGNSVQDDLDGDAVGDECDGDDDGDGVADHLDSCPIDQNAGQEDEDLDGVGDACDPAFNASFLVADIERLSQETIAIVRTMPNLQQGNNLISWLQAVADKTAMVLQRREAGTADVNLYRQVLNWCLAQLNQSRNFVIAKSSFANPQIPADKAASLLALIEEMRFQVQTLIDNS